MFFFLRIFYWKYYVLLLFLGVLFFLSTGNAVQTVFNKGEGTIIITEITTDEISHNRKNYFYANYDITNKNNGSHLGSGKIIAGSIDDINDIDFSLAKYKIGETLNILYNKKNTRSIYITDTLYGIWEGSIISGTLILGILLLMYLERKFLLTILLLIQKMYRKFRGNHTINICLIPDQTTYDMCMRLNRLDTGKYNLNSRTYIPHITLGMKTLNDDQIESLAEDFDKSQIHKIGSKILEYYYKEFSPGNTWSGIYIQKNSQLQSLQKQLLEFSKKYPDQVRSRETYAIDDFFEENEIAFFKEDEYIARDELHITLGTQEMEGHNTRVAEDVVFNKLVIGKIGNYGSVREILYSKKLH